MSEEMTKEKKKINSRKFIVWLVWLLITGGVMIISAVKSNFGENLISEVLRYFSGISMMYIGGNVVQKGAVAIADSLTAKGKEECLR